MDTNPHQMLKIRRATQISSLMPTCTVRTHSTADWNLHSKNSVLCLKNVFLIAMVWLALSPNVELNQICSRSLSYKGEGLGCEVRSIHVFSQLPAKRAYWQWLFTVKVKQPPPGPHRSFEVWALKYEGFMICNGRRIDAFELWCWRRLLRVPWTARRSNQFILKEINPENSLEGLTLKLKLWSFGHLMQRPWCWERLKVGGEGSDRGWDGWMASPTRWTWVDG